MASNPLVPQGILNRVRASLNVIGYPDMNAPASFLDVDGITMAFEGAGSDLIGTMTGGVPSAAPYQMVTATARLVKTAALAMVWKTQFETNANIGDVDITGDATNLADYYLSNAIVVSAPTDLNFAGKSAAFTIVVKGIYYINSDLFDAS